MSSAPPKASAEPKSPSGAINVVQHADVPELNLLLCGRHPEIYTAKELSNKKQATRNISSNDNNNNNNNNSIFPPTDSSTAPNPRFSMFQQTTNDETPPGEIPKTARSERYYKSKQFQQSQFFSQLRQEQDFTQKIGDKLDAYSSASKAKYLVHQSDFENHYYAPLQYRIKEQMSARNYNHYLKEKKRLIEEMDKNPVPITSPRKLPPIARIKVSTKGLKDPSTKFAEHQKEEEKLSKFIMKANGERVLEKKITPRNTLDYKEYSVNQQTRFFYGTDPEFGNKSGRKVFEGCSNSKIGKELNSFSES